VYDNPDPNDFGISRWGGDFNKRQVPVTWNIDTSDDGYGDLPITKKMETEEPRLYNRVVAIHKQPSGELYMEERVDMENSVAEGDAAIFWVDHFFPNLDQMLVINDGDAILIGLLYARERMDGNAFRNVQTLCLRYCKGKPAEGEVWAIPEEPPEYEYIDLNGLFCAIEEDTQFKAAGVNNHVLPHVFLSILAGNDFFGGYCQGIGNKVIITTFIEMIDMVSSVKAVVYTIY
jgi:hypothetical protein